jgi:hypothetical protein
MGKYEIGYYVQIKNRGEYANQAGTIVSIDTTAKPIQLSIELTNGNVIALAPKEVELTSQLLVSEGPRGRRPNSRVLTEVHVEAEPDSESEESDSSSDSDSSDATDVFEDAPPPPTNKRKRLR